MPMSLWNCLPSLHNTERKTNAPSSDARSHTPKGAFILFFMMMQHNRNRQLQGAETLAGRPSRRDQSVGMDARASQDHHIETIQVAVSDCEAFHSLRRPESLGLARPDRTVRPQPTPSRTRACSGREGRSGIRNTAHKDTSRPGCAMSTPTPPGPRVPITDGFTATRSHMTCNEDAFAVMVSAETASVSESAAFERKEDDIIDIVKPQDADRGRRLHQGHARSALVRARRGVHNARAEVEEGTLRARVSDVHQASRIDGTLEEASNVGGASVRPHRQGRWGRTPCNRQLPVKGIDNARSFLTIGALSVQVAMVVNQRWGLPHRDISSMIAALR